MEDKIYNRKLILLANEYTDRENQIKWNTAHESIGNEWNIFIAKYIIRDFRNEALDKVSDPSGLVAFVNLIPLIEMGALYTAANMIDSEDELLKKYKVILLQANDVEDLK